VIARGGGRGGRRWRLLAAAAFGVAALMTLHVPTAGAVILEPTVIDGPSTEAPTLGGVAMAPDGTGGVVYTKNLEGAPHVFVSRYDGSNWSAPIRVDGEEPLAASEPRIAASDGGRLLVVWATEIGTLVNGQARWGLYSASLGGGANQFAPALLVDPNIVGGANTAPSLAGALPGKAVVAYRVITQTFGTPGEFTNAVQLRPGDVIADIRVARLEGDRWSRLGAINRNPAASMRPPTETNGPQVGIGASGRAVVAWQEPDSTGTARIWMRRVTGTTLGPVYAASPETFGGRPVSDDATAFALSVSENDAARVAARVDGGPGSPLGGQRVFLTSIGSAVGAEGKTPAAPEPVEASPAAGAVGAPAIAISETGQPGGSMNLAFGAGSAIRTLGVDPQGKLTAASSLAGPPALPGTPVVATVDGEGGGVTAYEGFDPSGSPAVAVREEFPGGGSQTGLLDGPVGGAIGELVGAGPGDGDALLAFRQGEGGRFAIVADRVSAPPQAFGLTVPRGWVRPSRATVRWEAPQTAVGGLTYGLVLDGRTIASNLTERRMKPSAALLGSGVARVKVIATDRLGGDVISNPAKLKVDARPPSLDLQVRRARGEVTVRLKDKESGLAKGSVRIDFGDGSRKRGVAVAHHRYARAGHYKVTVRARDRVGNRRDQSVTVAVR
jgi:hypothetical protein